MGIRLGIAASALLAAVALGAALAARRAGLAVTGDLPAKVLVLGAHYVERRDVGYRAEGLGLYLEHCSVCHGDRASDAAALGSNASRGDLALFRLIRGGARSASMPDFTGRLSPSQTLRIVSYLGSGAGGEPAASLSAPGPLADGSYEILVVDGGLRIYRLDAGYAEVRQVRIPDLIDPRGCAASAVTGRLYVAYRKDLSAPEIRRQGVGWLSAIDLHSWQVLWTRAYAPSVDSFALAPDGRTLYMPSGEGRGVGTWLALDALDGDVLGELRFGEGAHNTIVGPTGERVYLGALGSRDLGVADARSLRLLRTIGPFGERIRPFAIDGRETFAFVNVDFLSGFEVADLRTGRVLHRVVVEGYPWKDPPLPLAQSHGIALTPDERELWVADAYNRRVHVFDVSDLPARPRQIASVSVADERYPYLEPKWIRVSRDGRWVHVSTGAVISAATRRVVHRIPATKHFLEVEVRGGEPVAAYSRYGNGYAR